MTDAHGFVREEDIFLDMLDESELDHLFEKEINNMRPEVISYRYVLIYFIKLLWLPGFLAECSRRLCPHMDSENKRNKSKFDTQLPVGIEFGSPVHELGYNHGTMFC